MLCVSSGLPMLEYMLNDHPLTVLSDELWVSINYEAAEQSIFLMPAKLDREHRNGWVSEADT